MNKETLEEAAEKNYENKTAQIPVPTSHWVDSKRLQIQNFIEGAKWQAENMPIYIVDVENTYVHIEDGVIIVEKNDKTKRMYSEEEVLKILCDFIYDINIDIDEINEIKEWFEQFKKK
jgi:hypothetical protein